MTSLRFITGIVSSRSFSSLVRKNIASVALNNSKSSRTFMSFVPRAGNGYLTTSSSFSRVCGCGIHHTSEGDHQLLAFLKEEINYEKATMKNLEKPKLEFFNQPDNLKELTFKMTRLLNGERVVVAFNVDQSINHEVDTPGDGDEEDDDEVGKITSYPSFSVQIIKDSGETLHFNCEYEIDDTEDTTDDEERELFTITDVSLLPHPDADHSNVYHCETENMDYNLYELLMGMLAERGVNNEFVMDLLKKSTILEHQQYMQFLEGLQDFLSQN